MAKRANLSKNISNEPWKRKLTKKIHPIHKQFTTKAVDRILRRTESVRRSLMVRSKKYSVVCSITVEELRQMTYDYYGQPCKFCNKLLVISNLVYDHIIPISKGGDSTVQNLQIICGSCNRIKSCLTQADFITLLNWLATMPVEFSKNVKSRLAGGIGY